MANSGVESREVLRIYSVELIDRYAEMSATGRYRYWFVIESRDGGESPTDAVLTDLPLAVAILIWIGACVVALAH